ncbi:hypothetical protein PHLGIDRAFT_29844 [Phlebiopsis gigantea 11061_1 CR5-6]|uniref:Methyltransferase domain-containing protein n=1 Tax=Phlebiopsis gigantea (strain 11061_1 CR5-6) TaxID=745531 RepID=A0A0C3RZN2_PHLG1|nr:hypothetical protein PHLGIDRAFT_29844 [Phlebiopsis gigantea 11061_1 CR5-6]
MSILSASSIASLCLHETKWFHIQLHQTEHRIDLISKWAVDLHGAKVLELGCGQGDCTAVLAEAVGSEGHVTAVDPASLDYGSPYTLGQAQSHLSSGRLGSRITWKQASPLTFLEESTETYDVAVLAHCLWYFSSPEVIAQTLRLLAARAKKVCIAEWSLSTSTPGAQAHLLAVLTQASLECRKTETTSNVRTVVAPVRIKELAASAGLVLDHEGLVTPGEGVRDGGWEAGTVVSKAFEAEVQESVKDERERSVVLALRDATVTSVAKLGGAKNVMPMDVWAGVLSVAGATSS